MSMETFWGLFFHLNWKKLHYNTDHLRQKTKKGKSTSADVFRLLLFHPQPINSVLSSLARYFPLRSPLIHASSSSFLISDGLRDLLTGFILNNPGESETQQGFTLQILIFPPSDFWKSYRCESIIILGCLDVPMHVLCEIHIG